MNTHSNHTQRTPLRLVLPLLPLLFLGCDKPNPPPNPAPTPPPTPTPVQALPEDAITQAFIAEFTPDTIPPGTTTTNGLDSTFPDEPIPDPFGFNTGTNALNPDTDWDKDLLKKNKLEDYANGKINFALLRKTQNYRKPAPDFPPELKALEGKTTEIIGFISPYDDIDSLKRFFVSNIASGCNFCTFPSLKDMIFVESKDGKEPPTGFGGLVRVKGTLMLKTKTSAYHSQDLIDEGFDHNIFDECIFILHDAESSVVKSQGFTAGGK